MAGGRKAVAALAAVALLAGAGIAALYLGSRRGDGNAAQPAASGASAPSAAEEASGPQAPAFPAKQCTVAWPGSWTKAIKGQPTRSGQFEVVPGHPEARIRITIGANSTLTWESPEGTYPITEAASVSFLYRITDGRFVVFLDEAGRVMAWDHEHPEASPRELAKLEMGSSAKHWFWVSDGYVWLQAADRDTNEVTVSVVDLAAGTPATEVVRGAGLDVYNALGETVQVRGADEKITLYHLDGTAEALPAAVDGYAITSVLDGVYLLTPLSKRRLEGAPNALWHPDWDEPFQLDGTASGLLGNGWVALGGHRFFNYETGVSVATADKTSGFLEGVPVINADGYLWWTAVAEDDPFPLGDKNGKLLPVARLPHVGCGDR